MSSKSGVCCSYDVPENPGELTQMRRKGQRMVLYAGCCLVFTGVVNEVMGVLTLVYKDGSQFPFSSASPIWSGGVALIGGIFAILTGVFELPADNTVPRRLTQWWMIAYGFQGGILVTNGMNFGYSLSGMISCQTGGDNCMGNVSLLTAFCAVAMVMSILADVSIIAISVITHKYHKILGFGRNRCGCYYSQWGGTSCEKQKQSSEALPPVYNNGFNKQPPGSNENI